MRLPECSGDRSSRKRSKPYCAAKPATVSEGCRGIAFWPPTNTSLPSVCTTLRRWPPTRISRRASFARYLADYIHEQGWQTYGDVVVRFEQSSNLRTGQYRARGAVNPDVEPRPTVNDPVRPQSNNAFGAERGVAPMTDDSSYRGAQGPGRPGDEYYDDRYGRPQDDPRGGPAPQGGADPRGGYPPEQGGYPPQQRLPTAARPRRLPRPGAGRLPRPTGLPRPGAGRLPRAAGLPGPARVPRPRRLPRATRLPRPGAGRLPGPGTGRLPAVV